jgi:hypothetical protein
MMFLSNFLLEVLPEERTGQHVRPQLNPLKSISGAMIGNFVGLRFDVSLQLTQYVLWLTSCMLCCCSCTPQLSRHALSTTYRGYKL